MSINLLILDLFMQNNVKVLVQVLFPLSVISSLCLPWRQATEHQIYIYLHSFFFIFLTHISIELRVGQMELILGFFTHWWCFLYQCRADEHHERNNSGWVGGLIPRDTADDLKIFPGFRKGLYMDLSYQEMFHLNKIPSTAKGTNPKLTL